MFAGHIADGACQQGVTQARESPMTSSTGPSLNSHSGCCPPSQEQDTDSRRPGQCLSIQTAKGSVVFTVHLDGGWSRRFEDHGIRFNVGATQAEEGWVHRRLAVRVHAIQRAREAEMMRGRGRQRGRRL